MRRTIGGNARDRRRQRRAAERRQRTGVAELAAADVAEIRQLALAGIVEATDFDAARESLLAQGILSEDEPLTAESIAQALGVELGGKPEEAPEEAALDALEEWEASASAREIATAYVKIRPDLSGFEEEVERVVTAALNQLRAAVGELVWGPEEGFLELLQDVNELLHVDGEDSPTALNASVALDKVLICDAGDYFVAPLAINSAGEPLLSDRQEWVEVEGAETEKMRFALRDLVLTSDGATSPELPAEHQPAEVLPPASSEPVPAPSPLHVVRSDGMIPWTATFVPEGLLTEDGRAFAPGALILPPGEGSRELPLTLMAMIETSAEGGHDGAKVAGRIDQLWRDGDLVKASGVFSQEEFGQMIARMVESKELTGLSVDIAPLEWERGPRSDWFDEEGKWIATQNDEGEWVPAGEPPSLEDAVEALFAGDDFILVITKGVIGMATVCPFPAFGDASISLAASGGAPLYRYETITDLALEQVLVASATETDCGCGCAEEVALAEEQAEVVTASAAGHAPVSPPASWFENPEFEELTPLTIDEDGRVYGHAWEWETCHLSFDGCVVAPHSETNYAYFMLGELECSDGERTPVGKVTFDTGHAGQRLSRAEATRHYDDTGTVAAHVVFGEDEFGGWFAGALDPDLDERALRKLRGATISGDWRGVEGNLELVALLAVNVPGFPVPRGPKAALSASGESTQVASLVAAGIVKEGLSAEQEDEIRQLAAEAEA